MEGSWDRADAADMQALWAGCTGTGPLPVRQRRLRCCTLAERCMGSSGPSWACAARAETHCNVLNTT
jgi:hypothetical protein